MPFVATPSAYICRWPSKRDPPRSTATSSCGRPQPLVGLLRLSPRSCSLHRLLALAQLPASPCPRLPARSCGRCCSSTPRSFIPNWTCGTASAEPLERAGRSCWRRRSQERRAAPPRETGREPGAGGCTLRADFVLPICVHCRWRPSSLQPSGVSCNSSYLSRLSPQSLLRHSTEANLFCQSASFL